MTYYPCTTGIHLGIGDRIVFLVGCPISIYCSLMLILGYFRIKNLRKRPGDLVLGMSISDIMLSTHWFIIGLQPTLVDYNMFCMINAGISTFAGINTLLYNISLCLFLIIDLRNVLKQSKIPYKIFHIINITASLTMVFTMFGMGKLGRTLYGTCSIAYTCKASPTGYFAVLIFFLYLFFGLYTYIYIKRNSPKCNLANERRAMVLSYYLNYVIASGMIWGTLATTYLFDYIYANQDESMHYSLPNDPKLQNIQMIGNLAKLCSPLVLTVIRYFSPDIRKDMQRVIFFWRKYDKNAQSLINNLDDEDNTLRSTLKLQLAFTFLASILIANNDQKKRYSSFKFDKPRRENKLNSIKLLEQEGLMEFDSNNKYKHNNIYVIKEENLINDKKYLDRFLKSKGLSIIEGTCKSYAPNIFRDFLNDETDIDLKESFDFEVNFESIKEAMKEESSTDKTKKKQGDGGKSGEFFLFSRDKKLILKSIPDNEKSKLLSCLSNYQNHLINNPNSFLARILGLYTFLRFDSDERYNLIIMRNMNGYPSKYVERTYDMKGSKFDRKVIKSKEDETPAMLKRVLKDEDFFNLEGKIYVCEADARLIINQIVKDVNFLCSCGFIDYSFIIFKINKANFSKDKLEYIKTKAQLASQASQAGQASQEAEENKKNNDFELFLEKSKHIKAYESTNPSEKGIFYHVGIIDFLQPWNLSKRLERLWKRISRANLNLDTSAQDPITYAERFKEEVIYKVFPDVINIFAVNILPDISS